MKELTNIQTRHYLKKHGRGAAIAALVKVAKGNVIANIIKPGSDLTTRYMTVSLDSYHVVVLTVDLKDGVILPFTIRIMNVFEVNPNTKDIDQSAIDCEIRRLLVKDLEMSKK